MRHVQDSRCYCEILHRSARYPCQPPLHPSPSVAPVTARPAIDTGRPYGSPFVPLATPAPASETGRIEHAGALTAEAEARVDHATAAGMDPATALRKALSAVGFSIHNEAKALAIPSKLRGVSKHQDTVARLAAHADQQRRGGLGLRLHVEVQDGQLAVGIRFPGGPVEPLGFVQGKHTAWLAPLVAVGATVCLSAVTGRQRGRTMGVNILLGFVGLAIQARRFQAGPEPNPGARDVILRRTREGDAEVRFGTDTAPVVDVYEWGYTGQGPSRLGLAVLRQFVSEDAAQSMAYDFIREVVATVPRAGVRIESGFVRAWIARHVTSTN